MREAVLAEVHGYVQGVGFRYFVSRLANRYRLSGWVRNTARGSVEILLCGEASALSTFRTEIAHGPRFSRVDSVDWTALSDDDPRLSDDTIAVGNFEVRY